MLFHEELTVKEAIAALSLAHPDSPVWVIGPDEKPTPASTVFRTLDPQMAGRKRVYVVARPWLEVPDERPDQLPGMDEQP